MLHYRAEHRDQIANCMLLTAAENGFNNKTDTPPAEWFAPKRFDSKEQHDRYMKLHLIPDVPELWQLNNYDYFIKARKALIKEKFRYMLLDERSHDLSSIIQPSSPKPTQVPHVI